MTPVYEKRRAIVKAINKFWPVALMNHPLIGMHAQHASDQAALSYLEDLWLVRDTAESRCFTLEFVSTPPRTHICGCARAHASRVTRTKRGR